MKVAERGPHFLSVRKESPGISNGPRLDGRLPTNESWASDKTVASNPALAILPFLFRAGLSTQSTITMEDFAGLP
jgi:hypothetical protein